MKLKYAAQVVQESLCVVRFAFSLFKSVQYIQYIFSIVQCLSTESSTATWPVASPRSCSAADCAAGLLPSYPSPSSELHEVRKGTRGHQGTPGDTRGHQGTAGDSRAREGQREGTIKIRHRAPSSVSGVSTRGVSSKAVRTAPEITCQVDLQ